MKNYSVQIKSISNRCLLLTIKSSSVIDILVLITKQQLAPVRNLVSPSPHYCPLSIYTIRLLGNPQNRSQPFTGQQHRLVGVNETNRIYVSAFNELQLSSPSYGFRLGSRGLSDCFKFTHKHMVHLFAPNTSERSDDDPDQVRTWPAAVMQCKLPDVIGDLGPETNPRGYLDRPASLSL